MQDLTVTLVQSDLVWEDNAANLQAFTRKLEQIQEETDLIVLPEMFNTGFSMNSEKLAQPVEGEAHSWMMEAARLKNAVVTGSIITEEDGLYFNRLIWAQPDGQYHRYDKRHLFRMADEHHYFSPGKSRLVVELKGWRICPLVCYDLRFPVWSRNKSDYDVLVYIAN